MRIAVTGAFGNVGARIVRELAEDRGHDVVAVVRRPGPVAPAARVETAVADYDEPARLRAAFRGADTMVLVSSDGPVAQVMVHHRNMVRSAAESGVGHIVALSGLDADLRSPFCYAVSNGYTEQLVRDSGCGFSIARASIFGEFFASFLQQARHTGQLRLAAGSGRVSLVSRTDVARALAALAAAPPTGGSHDITGPAALDPAEAAALAGDAWGAPIRYVPLTRAGHGREMVAAGEDDPWWVYAYTSMFDSIREQRWAAVSGEVLRLTGRPPLSLGTTLAERGAGGGPR